jgi:hypothetical protein
MIMKKYTFSITYHIIFSLMCCYSYGQTNISGIINAYTNVTTVTSGSCTACQVGCSDVLTVGSSSSFSVGDKVLIFQMQGAVIDQSQTATFGNISSLNNTGNYEIATVNSIPNATTVNVSPLTKTYSTSTSAIPGVTQLIKVPVYAGNVNVSATLTAQAWNGTTGGVLAFIASGNVILNANIDVSGLGFRGAVHHESSGADCSEARYYADETVDYVKGGRKGEGIATFIVGKERLRGKQANGGGGGTGHNGGGGGGGNGGAGGLGATMYPGCPNIAGQGLGGAQLTATPTATFMGGGAGAGDSNGNVGAETGGNGTNGGGIVIIQADSIINTVNTSKYSGTVGPASPTTGGFFTNSATEFANDYTAFTVFCPIVINSIVVNAQAAQTITVEVKSQDNSISIAGPASFAVPAGVSTVPVNFSVPVGVNYRFNISSTGSLYLRSTPAAFPYTVTDVVSFINVFANSTVRTSENAFAHNFNISAACGSGSYKINVSGINNVGVADTDGGGGGGAGGSAYLNVNGYRGEIDVLATGGRGCKVVGGACHPPGGGGGGGNICTRAAAPANLNVNAAGAAPGLVEQGNIVCFVPATGYNSAGATAGGNGSVCTGYTAISGCPLPVNFLSFTGKSIDGLNHLQWITTSEKNNSYFVIEKSKDGISYNSIGKVDGNGNSSSAHAYQFIDTEEEFQTYYRIMQVDLNGDKSYSNIIWLGTIKEPVDFSIYPNPAKGSFVVKLKGSTINECSLDFIDIHGRNIYKMSGKPNENEITLSDPGLAAGVYFVKLTSNFETKIQKLIIY